MGVECNLILLFVMQESLQEHCAGSSATVVSNFHSGSDHSFKDALRIITQFRMDSDR